jgi:hypothetical protein
MTRIEKLLSISSKALAPSPPSDGGIADGYALAPELMQMLERRNGFYAFESALHVFPCSSDPAAGMNFKLWNSNSLWRSHYQDLAAGLLFFAEDMVQDQFCLSTKGVLRFHAETGETEFFAASIESWADIILRDYECETAWPLAREWQAKQVPLAPGTRLMPKTPFFLGGPYAMENLWAGDAVEGMRFKADLAIDTRGLADGTQIRLVIGEKPKT